MNWRDKILADWPHDPQRAYKGRAALQELEGALQTLGSLGHPLHVEEGHQPVLPSGFPKTVFHVRAGQREVACQAELDELGEDWFPTLQEAQHAAGLIKQYQRGGIFDKNLPANPLSPEERRLVELRKMGEAEQEKKVINTLTSNTREAKRRSTALTVVKKMNGVVEMPGTQHE